ncbi:MAG TPA: HAMP domain-containing protein, partial [Anaerolinea sp.]|nr:HAMP domain-containing protein [Anaerolinea sp.]
MGWIGIAAAIFLGLRRWWEEPSSILRRRWWLFVVLALMAPFTSTIFGVRLALQTLPLPGVPLENGGTVLMFFAALPWVLGAGLLGPLPAVLLGGISGVFLGMYTTHSPFLPLETAGLALVFSHAVRQRYRTLLYRILRHPIGAAVILGMAFAPVYMLTTLFAVNGPLAIRLDYALTQTWQIILAHGIELFLAGLVGEVLYVTMPLWWGCLGPLLPSPPESSLQTRFFQGSLPLLVILILSLTLGDWLVAGSAARRMVEERLSSTTRLAAESLPYFMETGQSLIQSMATPDLIGNSEEPKTKEQVNALLAERLRSLRFFKQLALLNANGDIVAQFPAQPGQIILSNDERSGVQLAMSGVPFQMYTAPPAVDERSAQLSFISAVFSTDGTPAGVLIGRTDLVSNPFTRPAVEALDGIGDINGQGFLLDANSLVLYPLESSEINAYSTPLPGANSFFEGTGPDGTRSFAYYQKAEGSPWAIVMTVPALYTQQVALNIAIPLLVILMVVAIAAIILMRWSLGTITTTLHSLAQQASLIMRGELSRPVVVKGEDEIGQLANAFERMR